MGKKELLKAGLAWGPHVSSQNLALGGPGIAYFSLSGGPLPL